MENKDRRDGWLRDLKVGDKVIIQHSYKTAVKLIDKVTPTGRITIGNTQYDYTGREIGGDVWHREYLTQWSQEKENEILKQIKIQSMCNKLSEVKWKECSYELIEKMFLILEENKEELHKNRL